MPPSCHVLFLILVFTRFDHLQASRLIRLQADKVMVVMMVITVVTVVIVVVVTVVVMKVVMVVVVVMMVMMVVEVVLLVVLVLTVQHKEAKRKSVFEAETLALRSSRFVD